MAHLRAKGLEAIKVLHGSRVEQTDTFVHQTATLFERLKDYGRTLRAVGVDQLAHDLHEDSKRALAQLPLACLSESSAYDQDDPTAEMIASNKDTSGDLCQPHLLKADRYSEADGAAHLLFGESNPVVIQEALNSYCLVIESVGNSGSKYALIGAKSKKHYIGGWSKEGYTNVNLPSRHAFQNKEQSKVVFAIAGRKDIEKFLIDFELFWVVSHMNGFVDQCFPKNYRCVAKQVHVMFSFSAYTHYKWHTDVQDFENSGVTPGNMTFLVTLSPGTASFLIAGRNKEVKYEFPGDIKGFSSHLFHRTGSAESRTVKLAFFVDVLPPAEEVTLSDDNEEDEEEEEPTKVWPRPHDGGGAVLFHSMCMCSSVLCARCTGRQEAEEGEQGERKGEGEEDR